jgi:hypothetical protein
MRATVASPSEPPPLPRNERGQVVGSDAARRLAKIRVERCKQTGERYRTRQHSPVYGNMRLRTLLRNIIEEIIGTPIELDKGKPIDIVDELRKKVAKIIMECDDPKTVLEYTNMLARYTVSPPKAEENKKLKGNPDLERELGVEEEAKLARGPGQ